MIKTQLSDGNGGNSAEILKRITDIPDEYPSGVVAYTTPFHHEANRPITAINESGSVEMAVNGSTAGGSPDRIHDGTDSALWTGSNLTGANFIFNSSTQAQAGTQSIDATASVNNDQALLTRSTPIAFSGLSALTGFIYVDSWLIAGTKEVTLQFRLGGVNSGGSINLSDFIVEESQNAWQSFVIPLTEFGLTGTEIDELVITTIDTGGGQPPNYYLDELILASAAGGTPVTFTVGPRAGETILIKGFVYEFVFPWDPTATVAGATENFAANQYLSYNKFCQLTELTNGLNVRRIQNDVAGFSNNVRNNWDLLKATNHVIETFFADGANTVMKVATHFEGPVELSAKTGDRYEFTVNDDLSSLIHFNIRGRAVTLTPAED